MQRDTQPTPGEIFQQVGDLLRSGLKAFRSVPSDVANSSHVVEAARTHPQLQTAWTRATPQAAAEAMIWAARQAITNGFTDVPPGLVSIPASQILGMTAEHEAAHPAKPDAFSWPGAAFDYAETLVNAPDLDDEALYTFAVLDFLATVAADQRNNA